MSRRRGSPIPSAAARLLRRTEQRSARLGVVGLGYVGVPLAVEFGRAGFRVTGFDVDGKRIAQLKGSRSYIQDVPGSAIRDLVRSGNFVPTSDFLALKNVDIVNV